MYIEIADPLINSCDYIHKRNTQYSILVLSLFGKFNFLLLLYPRWIKHNSYSSSNTLWWQIPAKPTPDNTITSMGTAYLTPIDTELVSILASVYGCFGNKCNFFSEVKFCFFFAIYALDFNEGDGVVLGT